MCECVHVLLFSISFVGFELHNYVAVSFANVMGGVETIAVSSRVSILEVIMQATINKMIQARAQHPLVHDGSGEVFLETV